MGFIRKIFGTNEYLKRDLELIRKKKEQEKQKINELQEENIKCLEVQDENIRHTQEENARYLELQKEKAVLLEMQEKYDENRRLIKENKLNDFNNTLLKLPRYEARLTASKYKRNSVKDMPDYKFTNVTLKSIPEKMSCFVVIDTETTGLKATDSIIELSAIRYEDFLPVECFTALINPEKEISQGIIDITGITSDMVKSEPTLTKIVDSFLEFIGDDSLVGHNLSYDLKMLWSNGVNVFDSKRKYYDTLELSQKTLKKIKEKWNKEYEFYELDYDGEYDVENHKLDTLCDFYEIYRDVSHRALSDCLATGYVFKKLVETRTEKEL